jgi:Ca2+-binding RTX toxin-like protein
MRKIAILVGAVALLTMLFAGVAFARNFQCSDRPCYGTNSADTIFERAGTGVGDTIYARSGPDNVDASLFGGDNDFLNGQRGNDRLDATDGDFNDILNGGRGFDRCFGDVNAMTGESDTFVNCEFINGVAV